jgi:hypothetical protein
LRTLDVARLLLLMRPAISLLDARRAPELSAREELRRWATAREYWARAIEYLKLARGAIDSSVQNRYVTVAQHYRALALAEEQAADRMGDERRTPETRRGRQYVVRREVEARRVSALRPKNWDFWLLVFRCKAQRWPK